MKIFFDSLFRVRYSLWACFFVSIFTIFGLSGFHQAHSDHNSVMMLLLEDGGSGDSFFLIPIYFYSFFESIGLGAGNLSIMWGLLIIYLTFSMVRERWKFFIALYLVSPAAMTYLGIPSKELFMASFLLLFLHLYSRNSVGSSILTLLVYSVLFRYYAALYPLVMIYSRTGFRLGFVLLFFILILLLVFESSVYSFIADLTVRRDVFFELRSLDVRSTWYNPYDSSTWGGVVGNYFYALFRIQFPLLFDQSIKELYLQVYNLVIIFLIVFSAKRHALLVIPFIAIYLLYPLIEPDLGSYLRHVSSWFPLFIYLLSNNNMRLFISRKVM
jgi:hypothetical protein